MTKKVKSLNAFVEKNLKKTSSFVLTKEQLGVLDKEHKLHLAGESQSYIWHEAKEIIRGQRPLK